MNTETPKSLREVASGAASLMETPNPTPTKQDPDEATIVVAPPQSHPVEKSAENNPPIQEDPVPQPIPVATGLSQEALETPAVAIDQNGTTTPVSTLRDEQIEMLRELTPDMPEEERMTKGLPILREFESILKELVMNGLTLEEAKVGATNRVKRNIGAMYEEYKTENPDIGVITIDKTSDTNDLGLTADEHRKLERVKKIRLITIEDADLKNIKIERPDEKHKADYIKNIENSLSKYSVPLPMLGDFVTFRGAQIVQMANAVNYEDARLDEVVNTKASLIYDKLTGGSILKKYDETGKASLTYSEFINKFAYQDIDIALFGILCASSMEESSTSMTCPDCKHVWDAQYSVKNLLTHDKISDEYKSRIELILANKGNEVTMRGIYDSARAARRYKSPFSGNIYDVSYPTVARAINLFKRIDQKDSTMVYIAAIGLYLSRILVYNEARDSYIEVLASEIDMMLDTLRDLSNNDMQMLSTEINKTMIYQPTFAIKAKCPSCGKDLAPEVGIEQLVFLTAQDSMVAIGN